MGRWLTKLSWLEEEGVEFKVHVFDPEAGATVLLGPSQNFCASPDSVPNLLLTLSARGLLR
jgi:hypothetical protein